jgi:hypothetical protein
MNKVHIGLAMGVIGLLTACTSFPNQPSPPLNPGASLQINHEYDSLENGSRIYFQLGRRVYKGNFDPWETYCAIYVFNSEKNADYITSIQPGRFKVARVSSGKEVVENSTQFDSRLQLASNSGWLAYDPPSYIVYETRLALTSKQQPDVHSLTCYREVNMFGPHYPRLSDMRAALGSLIDIKLNSI